MDSNRKIKNRELFKARQEQIKILGDLKKAQQDLLLAMNECALAEVCHYNALQKGVVSLKMKQAIKKYFKAFGDKILNEEHIERLTEWKAVDSV